MKRATSWIRKLWANERSDELSSLETRLGYTFQDHDLLRLALTHRSFANERQLQQQNERLEFLGDAVLGLVTASHLYGEHDELPEGDLSRRKSNLVSEVSLASMAEAVGLGQVLRLGVGEDRSGGRSKPSLLADALEAVFGACYLDGGLPAARRVIEPLLTRVKEDSRDWHRRDAKTRLQETVQAHGGPPPRYRLVDEAGPDHTKTFTVECWIAGKSVGVGSGSSKKAAEQAAASAALENSELLDPPGDRS